MNNISEILPLMIPIVTLMIPIVAILTAHQRKMAELLHRPHEAGLGSEVQRLSQEVQALKELVYQQTLALEAATNRTHPPTHPEVSR